MIPRVVFMGSPAFAVPVFNALFDSFNLIAAVTQPDRRAGRGRRRVHSPVKSAAEAKGVPIFQPERIRSAEAIERLQAWDPDLIVVAAFGQILSQEVLDIPEHGSINVHASLLPRWRGASPIQQAILHGDSKTGVTIMIMDAGLDTGPILSMCSLDILPQDTGESLSAKLSHLGARLLVETIPGYLSGVLTPVPQPEESRTYAPLLKKKDGLLALESTAVALERQVRAYNPWPGAYLSIEDIKLKVHQAEPIPSSLSPGHRANVNGYPAIGTAEGALLLIKVQPPGKRAMPGDEYLRGARDWET